MTAKKATKRFPYIATVIAFSAIVIMLSLGFWQLERKVEKDERLESIKIAKQSENITMQQAFSDIEAFQDYVVTANGQPIEKYFYIDNKIVEGRAGFHVLVPYKTDSSVVMLNLGWLAATGLRSELPKFKLPAFDKVQGILYIPLNNRLVSETNTQYGEFPALLQQVDLAEISKHLNIDVLPAVLRLLPEQSDFSREWKPVVMSPDKHLGYAVQWFGLAVAGLTVYLLSVVKWMQGPSPTGSEAQKHQDKNRK